MNTDPCRTRLWQQTERNDMKLQEEIRNQKLNNAYKNLNDIGITADNVPNWRAVRGCFASLISIILDMDNEIHKLKSRKE